MKLEYRLRFWYAACVFLMTMIVGYGVDLYPLQQHINRLQKNIADAKRTARLSVLSSHTIIIKPQAQLAALLQTAHLHQLTIDTLSLVSEKVVHIIAQGEISAIVPYLTHLLDFSLKATPSGIKLDADLSLQAEDNQEMLSIAPQIFCKAKAHLFYQEKLSTLPLHDLKMVGYLQLGAEQRALLLLPDNHLTWVKKNSIVGKEKAIVKTITSQQILLVLPNQQQIQLTR